MHVLAERSIARIDRGRALFCWAALIPPCLAGLVLWVLPVSMLTADRTAMAARDYTVMWVAGHFAALGQGYLFFSPVEFNASIRALFGAGFPEQIWPYPPTMLLLAVPASGLSLVGGFVLYTFGSLGLLWSAIRLAGLSSLACAAIVVSPAALDNALAGQNGALTAAALLGGLLLVERRPVVAGLVMGSLVIKPQFALLLPVCLVAAHNWRALAGLAASAATLIGLSAALFGIGAWIGFLERTRPIVAAILEAPWQGTPSQQIFASLLMAARSLGAGQVLAYAVQAVVTMLCVIVAWRTWRTPASDPVLRVALTGVLVLAASPWTHSYDMIPLSLAVMALSDAAKPLVKLVLAFAWFWPGATILLGIPLALSVASVVVVGWFAWRRMYPDRGAASSAAEISRNRPAG